MKPLHVLKFVTFKTAVFREKYAVNHKLFMTSKKEYENKFFAKLFNLKYDDGTWSYWDFHTYSIYIKELANIQLEAEYAIDMGYDIMTMNDEGWKESFYKWYGNTGVEE